MKIDDQVLNEAKKLALGSQSTLSEVVETALREMLNKRQPKSQKHKSKLITYNGRGLRRGIDLDDTAALLDVMEGR